MVSVGNNICPRCGHMDLKYYDKVSRVVRIKNAIAIRITIRRVRCRHCGAIHRELPNYIFPYKQYRADIIRKVIEKTITSDTIGYENYPCEMTMMRWLSQNHRDCFVNEHTL